MVDPNTDHIGLQALQVIYLGLTQLFGLVKVEELRDFNIHINLVFQIPNARIVYLFVLHL